MKVDVQQENVYTKILTGNHILDNHFFIRIVLHITYHLLSSPRVCDPREEMVKSKKIISLCVTINVSFNTF